MKRIKERKKRSWELPPDDPRRIEAENRAFWEKCKWIMEVGVEPCPHCGKNKSGK